MKNCKLIIVSLILMLFLISGIFFNTVIAESMSPPLYFGITELRTLSTPNLGYAIGDPNTNGVTGSAAKIWNIVKYSNSNFADPTEVNVYCVKAGVGFSDTKKTAEYDLKFDMVKDKEQIAAQNSVLNGLVNNGHYNELLALADLLYLPGQSEPSERTTLLNNAGIYDEAYDFDITDDEIKAIQQAAIWYFTNYGEENNKYDKYNNTAWLWYTENGSTYKNLSDYNPTETVPNASAGHQRQEQAELLYKYLIDTAKANSSNSNHKSKLTLYASSKNNQEQPLMDIERIPQEFDLALRKYITKINGKNVADTRVPSIDKTTLDNGTTATYKHRKDPILVKNGDIVTYNLTIYNEGDIEGRATKIIDQLPTGLVYSKINTTGYTANYDKATNKIMITKTENNNLTPYTGGDIASETIEIECTVEANNETKILTNVAWISEEVDANGTIITNQKGADRDSEPTTAPNVNKDNMSEYKGNNSNKSELDDPNYFYKGEQDDDDFEKLRIEKVTGEYQIQLEKVDKDNPSTKLSGAEFEVTLPGGQPTKKVTGENGILDLGTVKIEDVTTKDTIQVKETKAPEGYNKILDIMTIEVEKQNSNGKYGLKSAKIVSGQVEGTSVGIEGNTIKIVVGNEKIKNFDLSLRKFITNVNDKKYDRVPKVDVTNLKDKSETTSVYNHPKKELHVAKNDIITYTIRVYNEGQLDGYAEEVTDFLPKELEFLPDNDINQKYEWELSEDGRTITTYYLSKAKENSDRENLIKAFDGEKLDYKDLQIACKVKDKVEPGKKITNIAAITEDADKNGKEIEDIDSDPSKITIPSDEKLPSYKDDEIDKEYVPGQEDDDDFEKVVVQEFDLALRKFITNIDGKDVTTRVPQPVYDKEKDKIAYNHPKDPMDVVTGDIVTYTIRVYNEGDIDGYAQLVSDDIPDGLKFLPENETNVKYRWVMYDKEGKETEKVEEAEKITTDYLSKEQEEKEGENLLKAFNKNEEISETNPDHRDIEVAFEVVEPNGSDKVIINSAQISEDSDKEGNPVEDKDSTPDKWVEGEDDQDKEYIKLRYFDLALRKWVTEAIVIEDGKQTVTQTGHTPDMDPEPVVKVELHRKDINKVTVKFRYSIRVTNEGDIPGYVKEITDYVPEGLKFVAEDNPYWKDEGNNIISTTKLENTLLQPGESADVEVLLTWINGKDNMGLKTNIAEISKDYNDKGVPDRNSTPDNKKPGEDDIDDAPVILSIETGKAITYVGLGLVVLVTIAGGVFLIKKYVI